MSQIGFTTLFGKIQLPSYYMWKKGEALNTTQAFGVVHNGKSPSVEAALVDFGSEHSFEEAAQIFERHYKFTVSDSTIRRVTETIGLEAEKFISEKLDDFSKADEEGVSTVPEAPVVILGFDGCSIRTGELQQIEGAKEGVKGQRKRKEEWKDIRLGFVRDLSEESKKWFVGGLKGYPDLMDELFNLALGRGMNEYTQPVAVADGGISIYEEASERFQDLQFILDYYHFSQHLYETAEAMSLNKEAIGIWVGQMKGLAFNGNIHELRECLEKEFERTGVDRLRRMIGYVERFQDCLNYSEYRSLGYPIGSGEVESSHRYITQKRLKIAGACWRKENINPMLAVRILKANGWWKDFWQDRTERLAA